MSSPASSPLLTSLLAAPLPQRGISWLDAARQENREAFAAGGLPDTRVEAWKYTPLRALAQRSFVSGDSDAATRVVDPALFAVPGVDGPRLVFVNGVFRADLSALAALPAGLVLQPLSRALVVMSYAPGGEKMKLSGTSMAAPQVAGQLLLGLPLPTDHEVLRLDTTVTHRLLAAPAATARRTHLLTSARPALVRADRIDRRARAGARTYA